MLLLFLALFSASLISSVTAIDYCANASDPLLIDNITTLNPDEYFAFGCEINKLVFFANYTPNYPLTGVVDIHIANVTLNQAINFISIVLANGAIPENQIPIHIMIENSVFKHDSYIRFDGVLPHHSFIKINNNTFDMTSSPINFNSRAILSDALIMITLNSILGSGQNAVIFEDDLTITAKGSLIINDNTIKNRARVSFLFKFDLELENESSFSLNRNIFDNNIKRIIACSGNLTFNQSIVFQACNITIDNNKVQKLDNTIATDNFVLLYNSFPCPDDTTTTQAPTTTDTTETETTTEEPTNETNSNTANATTPNATATDTTSEDNNTTTVDANTTTSAGGLETSNASSSNYSDTNHSTEQSTHEQSTSIFTTAEDSGGAGDEDEEKKKKIILIVLIIVVVVVMIIVIIIVICVVMHRESDEEDDDDVEGGGKGAAGALTPPSLSDQWSQNQKAAVASDEDANKNNSNDESAEDMHVPLAEEEDAEDFIWGEEGGDENEGSIFASGSEGEEMNAL